MASYRYTVTIQEPERVVYEHAIRLVRTHPVATNFSGTRRNGRTSAARDAIAYARAQHRSPDGTSIVIHRRRLRRWRDGGVSGVETTGPELVYRRYVVQGGIVKRVEE